uniref:Putative ovule protein n=1 Tax=Solanum chacoense TaxID=4108 RepID=A0A0V0HE65_SOLCH
MIDSLGGDFAVDVVFTVVTVVAHGTSLEILSVGCVAPARGAIRLSGCAGRPLSSGSIRCYALDSLKKLPLCIKVFVCVESVYLEREKVMDTSFLRDWFTC